MLRFQCSIVKSPVLKCVTMIDTPGILSGEKQRVDRGYDFVGVLQWFAERVDRWKNIPRLNILLLKSSSGLFFSLTPTSWISRTSFGDPSKQSMATRTKSESSWTRRIRWLPPFRENQQQNDQTSGRPPRTDASLWCSHVVDIQGLILVSRHILQDHSKVINVPECPKIYVGSFWDQQLKHDLYRRLFEKELQSLFDDLQDLPR